MRRAALLLAVLLVGCATTQPPAVVVAPCSSALVAQTQWLQVNLQRLALGSSRQVALATIGPPARTESFVPNPATAPVHGGPVPQVVHVLFYHTANTVCRWPDTHPQLLPVVFQNDRLIGFGPEYFQFVVAPWLQPITAKPSPAAASGPPPPGWHVATPLPPAPATAGRVVQEDLPTPPPANSSTPIGLRAAAAYSSGMQNPYAPASSLGRGEPLQ
jgi:hypothetical protein